MTALIQTELMTLRRLGRKPWTSVRDDLAAATCAWADPDGFHVELGTDLPQEIVGCTHLWAWADGRAWRVRFDGSEALVARLDAGHHDVGAIGQTVTAHVRPGQPWAEGQKEAGPLSAAAYTLSFELIELTGRTPVVFVRAKSRT
jgi:hypothetical protein